MKFPGVGSRESSDENVLKNKFLCDGAFDDGAGATDDSDDGAPYVKCETA